MWAKRGSQPQVKSAPTREKVAFSGFINPVTGVLITSQCLKFNYETMMNSVKSFVTTLSEEKKVLVILDNAPWHKKAVRLMCSDEEYKKVSFLFLPPYSPELNPIERVWRITRRERTHNRFFEKVQVLQTTLTSYFDMFTIPNKKLQTLCS